MRTAALTLTAALLVLSGCGSAREPDATPDGPSTAPTSAAATPAPPSTGTPATKAQVRSVIDDVQEYAPALEQVYFSDGYPDDLAGARRTAEQLTNLSLSPGNRIAGYRYDASDQEFQLCIENTSGAYAVYDTSPMSTTESGKSGGCPD